MAEWRIVYAGLREKFPELDRTIVRSAAEKFSNEEDAASFLFDQLEGQQHTSWAAPAVAETRSGLLVTSDASPSGLLVAAENEEHSQPQSSKDDIDAGEGSDAGRLNIEQGTSRTESDTLESWDPYVQAAVTAARQSVEMEVQALVATPTDTAPEQLPLESSMALGKAGDLLGSREQEVEESVCLGKETPEEMTSPSNHDSGQDDVPNLENLVEQSLLEKEKLAAELAAYAQLQETAAAREAEVEAAKERLRVAGNVEQRQMEQTRQAVDRLREENERRRGGVNGELAMLATEAKELRRNLAFLKLERTAIRTTLGQLQAGLHDRVASAEATISLADAQAGERRALAQAALDVVEAKMAATEAEKADLDRQEAEANKLHSCIMDKGRLVDSMLAEVAMLREDLLSVERLASSSRSGIGSQPIVSSFLTVGQAGSALRRSSHSQGDAVLSNSVDEKVGLEMQAEVKDIGSEGLAASKSSDGELSVEANIPGELDDLPQLVSGSCTSAGGSEHSSQASMPSLLSQSAQSCFQSANASMRNSQAPFGEVNDYFTAGNNQGGTAATQSRDSSEIGEAYAGHMGLYGPSPSNLASQYMGVFQQQVVPSFNDDHEQEEEGWAMLESDSSSSVTHA